MHIVFVDAGSEDFGPIRDELASAGNTVLGTGEREGDPMLSLASEHADLVVIARSVWMMADTELCGRLRARGTTAPILAVSGPCDALQRATALRAGADDFLSAPFELDELVARAAALVRRVSSQARRARAGVFCVDFSTRQVLVLGRALSLTVREYDLLVALIEHVGEVLTRRALTAHMSRRISVRDSNAVDVHMSRIREKLGSYASELETVRGSGYRLKRS